MQLSCGGWTCESCTTLLRMNGLATEATHPANSISLSHRLGRRPGENRCHNILMHRRMISGEPEPHAIENDDAHGEANKQDISCGGYRKNPHQWIHGVHGSMKDRYSQYAPVGSVVDPGKQNSDKRVQCNSYQPVPTLLVLQNVVWDMPDHHEEPQN